MRTANREPRTAERVKVLSAEFVTSATGAPKGIPPDAPQVALAGRSNVGKSTLINALCRRKIARTSAAPGKTRLANIYRVRFEGPGTRELYLVDLPGYGYARGGEDAAQELRVVAEAYLTQGKRLRPQRGAGVPNAAPALGWPAGRKPAEGRPPSDSERGSGPASAERSGRAAGINRMPLEVLLLIDSRHPGLEADLGAHAWLASLGIDPYLVATKIDKLSRSERARNLKTLGDVFGTAALPVSAQSGEGLNELWQLIIRLAKSR